MASKEIQIEPIVGEPARFFASSRSSQLPHLVDIEENEGRGWCGCPDFSFRRQPLIERGQDVEPCKHLRAVLDFIERN